VDAHAALCLEGARLGELASAARECAIAADAAEDRYWIHPTPGRLRSQNAAVAHLVLATEVTRRAVAEPVEPLLARAVQLAPESADIWAGRGAILLDRKDGPGAENAFERALALDPSHRPAAEGLGRAQALVRGGSR
jgi:Flp pilus assembly protein TadD